MEGISGRPTLSIKEIRFVAMITLGLIIVTSIPYLLGHIQPFKTSKFNENMVFDADLNSYFAFMRQSEQGQWLFHNPFTSEPHEPVFFNLEWFVVGKFASLAKVSLETAFQLQRITLIFLLCFSFYFLSTFFFETVMMRRIIFIMAMFGGGFGWVLALPIFGSHLPDWRFYDTWTGFHPFFSMLLQPHFLMAQTFSTLTLCLFLIAETMHLKRYYLLAALCCVIVGSMRPFDMLFLMVAITIYLAILTFGRRDSNLLFYKILFVIMPIPLMSYYLWLMKIHPVFQWWSIQNILKPPPPSSLVVTLGVAFILLAFNLKNLGNLKDSSAANALIACCFLSSIALIYCYPVLKFTLQFETTIVIPSLFVGTMSLEKKIIRAVQRSRWTIVGIVMILILNSLTSVLLLKGKIQEVADGKHRTDIQLLAAYKWLDKESEPRDVILPSSSYPTGNQIPRYTHNSVFSGYHFNTVNFREKNRMVKKFFDIDTNDSFRQDFLNRFDIRYIFIRIGDIKLGGYNPHTSKFLEEVFKNDAVRIYKVLVSPGRS